MKVFKIVSNVLLLVAIVFLGYSYVNKNGIFSKLKEPVDTANSGTEQQEVLSSSFSNLINQEGKVVSSTDFAGRHMLVIFGFSACKRTCPAELGMASQLLNRLGEDANRLQVLFITIDPKNDTVEKLKGYHRAFDSRIQMLTGSEDAISNAINNYKVYVGKQHHEGGDVDHSSFMYLIDGTGKYVAHFSPDFDSPEGKADELFAFVSKYLLNA